MKLNIFALLVLCLIFACQEMPPVATPPSPLENQIKSSIQHIEQGQVHIFEIEDCEYIVYKDAGGTNHAFGYMAHKGNCKNPIHCHNQSMKISEPVDSTEQIKDIQ